MFFPSHVWTHMDTRFFLTKIDRCGTRAPASVKIRLRYCPPQNEHFRFEWGWFSVFDMLLKLHIVTKHHSVFFYQGPPSHMHLLFFLPHIHLYAPDLHPHSHINTINQSRSIIKFRWKKSNTNNNAEINIVTFPPNYSSISLNKNTIFNSHKSIKLLIRSLFSTFFTWRILTGNESHQIMALWLLFIL